MLPTKGYFQDIECPFNNTGCVRPYCHFRHRKKPSDPEETPNVSTVPTYKPTPKSELAKSHIPISYVPDLAFRTERSSRPRIEKPIYKPTPLSILSSVSKKGGSSSDNEEHRDTIKGLKQSIANNAYDPSNSEICLEDLTNEFNLIDEIINEDDDLEAEEVPAEGYIESVLGVEKNGTKVNEDNKGAVEHENIESTTTDQLIEKHVVQFKKEDRVVEKKSKLKERISEKDGVQSDQHKRHSSKDKDDEKGSEKAPENVSSSKKHSKKGRDSSSSAERTREKSSEVTAEKTSKSTKEKNSEKDHSKVEKDNSKGEKTKNSSHSDKKDKDKLHSKQKCRDSEKDKSDPSNSSKSSKEKSSNKEKHNKSKNKDKSTKVKDRSRSRSKNRSRSPSSEKDKKKQVDKKKDSDKHRSKSTSKNRSRSPSLDKERKKQSDKKKDSSKHRSRSASKNRSRSPSSDKERKKQSDKKKDSNKHRSRSASKNRSISPSSDKDKRKHNDKKKDKSKRKSRSTSKNRSRSPSLNKERKKHSDKKKDSRKHRSRSTSSNRSPSPDKKKSLDKKKRKRKDRSRSRSRSSSRDTDKKKSDKKKEKSKSTDKEKSSSRSHKHKKEEHKTKSASTEICSSSDEADKFESRFSDQEPAVSDLDLDFEDEDETLRECYRIFNEYKPETVKKPPDPPQIKSEPVDMSDTPESTMLGKKRTAHPGASQYEVPQKIPPPIKPKPISTPGQILANRYKVAKVMQASREQECLMKEVEEITQQSAKRPAPTLLEAARQHKMKRIMAVEKKEPKSLVDDIINGTVKQTSSQPVKIQKKIAAVPNVALIQKAKERISHIKARPQPSPVKTIAQTQKQGRVAHVPEFSLEDIPDVLHAEKSKLPVNVRTRFLTMIADECLKLYGLRDEAYQRALNEEFACYEKCNVVATYRNSAMLAVHKLRREIQDREGKGLGLIGFGEVSETDKDKDFKGKRFYDLVKKWVLTEEELDIHGFPKESGERGIATIANRKEQSYGHLDDNHRYCARCSKLYQVDDDGWPLYEEGCMYHPLKRRTIRGERVYLCCKSTDEAGCVTSDTHVYNGSESAQLEGYQTTMDPESEDDPRSYAVYALDCEMCYTTKGLELTRVTIVDTDCKTVYESFVKPINPIIDYNTRFSGITKEQMEKTSTSILQIQANILHLCNSKTILVGHSLESDMKALKIVHGTIIDTSVLFPHKMGLPHKRALKVLASEYLKKIIQDDVGGHDSAEDAVTCMELIKWKLKEELKVKTK